MLIGLRQRPSPPCQQRHPIANGQVHALNERRLDQPPETVHLQRVVQRTALAPQHTCDGVLDLAVMTSLDQLTMQQTIIHLPMVFASARRPEPAPEMRGHCMKVRSEEHTSELQSLAYL